MKAISKTIPVGWTISKLGLLDMEWFKGVNAKKVDNFTGDYLIPSAAVFPEKIYTNKGTPIELHSTRDRAKKLKYGDVLFNSGGEGTLGRSAFFTLTDQNYFGDSFVLAIRSQSISSKFLFYVLNISKTQSLIRKYTNGSTGITSIKEADIKKFEIEFPKLTKEQEKIAEILSVIDDVIEKTEIVIEKYKSIKIGMMQDVFRYGVGLDGKIRSESAGHLKNSVLGLIPEKWRIEKIKNLVSFPTGQVDPKKLPFREMVLMAPDHIEQGTGTILEFKTAGEQGAISGKYFAKKGAVIYSKIRPNLAKVAFTNFDCLCSADMYPLLPAAGKLLNTFLFFSLLTNRFTEFATMSSARSNFPKINRNELGDFDLLVPEIDEQRKISDLLITANQSIEKEEFYKQKLLSIKRGLLEDLFTGVVRVNHLIGK